MKIVRKTFTFRIQIGDIFCIIYYTTIYRRIFGLLFSIHNYKLRIITEGDRTFKTWTKTK
jgi:hypothetical protein